MAGVVGWFPRGRGPSFGVLSRAGADRLTEPTQDTTTAEKSGRVIMITHTQSYYFNIKI